MSPHDGPSLLGSCLCCLCPYNIDHTILIRNLAFPNISKHVNDLSAKLSTKIRKLSLTA